MKKYDNPSVTVDIIVCSIIEDDLKVLLIKRKFSPFKHSWAIPGGFVEKSENLEEAAIRELREETGIEQEVYLEQLKTYGNPDRDPRKRVITVVYFSLMSYQLLETNKIKAEDDAEDFEWFSLRNLPKLAFDHEQILKDLLERLIGKISYSPIAFYFLSKKFTWTELQKTYEIVLGKKLVSSNFRRKIKSVYEIKKLSDKQEKGIGRRPIFLEYKRQIKYWK